MVARPNESIKVHLHVVCVPLPRGFRRFRLRRRWNTRHADIYLAGSIRSVFTARIHVSEIGLAVVCHWLHALRIFLDLEMRQFET